MNINNALRSLSDGQAARPAGWLGYVERVDRTPDAPYDSSETYSVGDKVTYGGSRYVCIVAGATGSFDSDKWARIGSDYYIVFVDKKDDSSDDPDATDNPSAVYRADAKTDGSVTWSRLSSGSAIPQEVKDAHGGAWDNKTIPSPMVDMPDEELFAAIVGDTWDVGSVSDFERQRQGGSGRW